MGLLQRRPAAALPARLRSPRGRVIARCALALCVLGSLSGLSGRALAHDEPPPPPEEESVATDGEPEKEIVVRGERAPRVASGVVRKRPLLEAAPQGSGSELLRTVPGIFASQHGGQGKAHQFFFRGFNAVHGQDMEVWVAGAPVNEVSHIHGQGYVDLHFVPPEVVQRLELLPGAYDPSQGDFAIAGSLRVGLGYEEPGVTARVSVGSFGARRLFLAYHPEGASAETFGAFELFRSDGFGVGRASERASAIGQIVHPLEDDLTLRLMASSYVGRFDSAGVLRQEDVDFGRVPRFGSYDLDQGGRSHRSQVVAELKHEDERAELSIAPYVVLRQLELRYDYTGYLTRPDLGDRTDQRNESITAGLRSQYRQRVHLFRADDALEVGIGARNDWIDQSQSWTVVFDGADGRLVDARVRTTTVSGYVDAELHPIRRVLVRGGVRAEGVSFAVDDERSGRRAASHGTFLGERLAVDVVLAPRLHGVASWGRGFRTPQARSVPDGARIPLTLARSAELGFRWEGPAEGPTQRATLAAYWNDLSNDLVFDERLGRNEAAPATQRWGVAANLETMLGDWFVSGVGLTATRAVFTESAGRFATGQLVPYAPQLVARTDWALRPRLGHFGGEELRGHFGVGIQGSFRRPLLYGEFGRDVVMTDVRLGVRTRSAELLLDVRNVLDLDWNDGEFVYASQFDPAVPPSALPTRHFSAGEPRSVFLSAALHL